MSESESTPAVPLPESAPPRGTFPLLAALAAVALVIALAILGPILWPLESAWIDRTPTSVGYDFRGAAPIPVVVWLAAGGILAMAALVGAILLRRRGLADRRVLTIAALAMIALAIGLFYHQTTLRRAVAILESDLHMRDLAKAAAEYDDTVLGLPLSYNANSVGQPLLSWRVHLLPYLGRADLYKQFHLDEPWDSPHNRPLLEKMPDIYRSGGDQSAPGRTRILAVTGPRTFLALPNPGQFGQTTPKGLRWNDATRDGASNIVALVEVTPELSVEWTKPQDFDPWAAGAYDRLFEGVPWVRAAFADGRVTLLERRYVTEDELKSAADRDDGRIVNLDY
jgi:hypothetical protein